MRSFKEVIGSPGWVLPLRGGSQELPRLGREQGEGTEGVPFPWICLFQKRHRPDIGCVIVPE